jgi:hypothetical protein
MGSQAKTSAPTVLVMLYLEADPLRFHPIWVMRGWVTTIDDASRHPAVM